MPALPRDSNGEAIQNSVLNTDGSVSQVGRSNPLPVGASMDVIPSNAGAVAASAHATKTCYGGKLTLQNVMLSSGGTGTLQSVLVRDTTNSRFTGSLILFDSDPTASTLTDAVAIAISTDGNKVRRVIPFNSTDWVTIGTEAFLDLQVGRALKSAGSPHMYAALQVEFASITPGGAGSVTVSLGVLRD